MKPYQLGTTVVDSNSQCIECGAHLDHLGPMPGFMFFSFNMRPEDGLRLQEALTNAAPCSGGGRCEDDLNHIITKWLETVTEPPVADRIEDDKQRGLQKIEEARP